MNLPNINPVDLGNYEIEVIIFDVKSGKKTKHRVKLALFYSQGDYFNKAVQEELKAQQELLALAIKELEDALIEAFGFLPIRSKRKELERLELTDIRLDRSHILTL